MPASGGSPPVVDRGTLVTPQRTLLRGVHWTLDRDYSRVAPTAAQWNAANLPGRGINAVHLYAERAGDSWVPGGPHLAAGYNMCEIDAMVSATAARGLYLIITVGNSGSTDRDFTNAFWNIYAPRYKNYAHVVYEAKNETHFSVPVDQQILLDNLSFYQTIRAHAPNKVVMLMSYPFFQVAGLEDDIEWFGTNGVDWSKTLLSFHSYESAASSKAGILKANSLGVSVMETEGGCLETPPGGDCPNPFAHLEWSRLETWESTGTSWLAFMPITDVSDTTWNFPIVTEKFVWAADAGTFPATSAPPADNTQVTLQAADTLKYVRVDGATSRLFADQNTGGLSSRFTVVRQPGGRWVALRSAVNNKFLAVETLGVDLLATSQDPTWFEWITRPGGQVSLQAIANDLFVAPDFLASATSPPLKAATIRGGGFGEAFNVATVTAGAPEITLTSPTANQPFKPGSAVVASAVAQPPAGFTVSRVEFHYGATMLADTTSPYSATFTSSVGQTHGSTQTVRATVFASNGASTSSAVVTIRFDSQVDAVAITAPAANAVLPAGAITLVQASASDTSGIQSVELIVNNNPGTVDTQPPYSMYWAGSVGTHSLTARATDSLGNMRTSTPVTVTVVGCQPTNKRICLQNGRFAVTIRYQAPGGEGEGLVTNYPSSSYPYGDATGSFYFFDPNNVEVVAKVLDGRPINGHWWLYHGGATDLAYTLTITDISRQVTREFPHTAGNFCGGRTVVAFPDSLTGPNAESLLADAPPAEEDGEYWMEFEDSGSGELAAPSCVSDNDTLCLQGNRFELEVNWKDYQNVTGTGKRVPINAGSGYFWFFSNDQPELIVKVLDGRPINGKWWVYFGAMTDVEYHLKVRDTVNLANPIRAYDNALTNYCGQGDPNAFLDQ